MLGNHNSNFMQALVAALQGNMSDLLEASSSIDEEDLDNDFRMEERGFCCFTNSLPIIYLHVWLNEKPGLTGFVCRMIPVEIQMDSLGNIASEKRSMALSSASSEQNRKKMSPGELMADAMISLVFFWREGMMTRQTGSLHDLMKSIMKCLAESEQIKLLETNLAALRKKVKHCNDQDLLQWYNKSMTKLEDEYKKLLLSGNTDDEDI